MCSNSLRISVCPVTSATVYIHRDFYTMSIRQYTSLGQEMVRIEGMRLVVYLSNMRQAWETETKKSSVGPQDQLNPVLQQAVPSGWLKNKNETIPEAQTKA